MTPIIIVISVLILIEFIAERLYMKTEKYRSSLGGAGKFYNVPNGIEICNIGSGPGLYAIDYELSPKKGFNFSTAPQNYKYGFRLLKRFHESIEKDAIIIIIIMCPLSFGKNKDYERKGYSDKYYHFLKKEDIDGYSTTRKIILNHPLAYQCFKKLKELFKKEAGYSKDSPQKRSSVVEIWRKEFDLKDLIDPNQTDKHEEAFREKIEILSSGLDYCRAQNWRPVFVIPPIPQKTRSHIGDQFLEVFVYRNLREVMNRNPNVKLLDYFSCPMQDDEFMNDIFMNHAGREHFSKKLFEDIKREIGD